MSHIPFVLRAAQPFNEPFERTDKDVHLNLDPLPPALETDSRGIVLVGKTRVTEVRYETTDDN